jgi:hypothetical protein
MKRRAWLLLAAALVIAALLLYPSSQCHVNKTDVTISPLKTFVINAQEGFAVGFTFNATNRGGCEINARNIHVVLRNVTYAGGRKGPQTSDEGEAVNSILTPGGTGLFSYTFNSYFAYRPTMLNLRVELTFAETGPVLVFDGDLPVNA